MCSLRQLVWQIFLIVIYGFLHKNSNIIHGKTYYFKANTSNEFQIYNRIQLNENNKFINNNNNSSVINHRTKIYMRAHSPNIKHENKISNQFLDAEWNYDWKQISNKTNLPVYIHKLYASIQENLNNQIYPQTPIKRILFNSQQNEEQSNIIKFNLNSLNAQENVSDIELHFYLTINNNSTEIYKQSIVVRLYQIENATNSNENPDIHRLLNVIYIFQAENGWQLFKIRTALNNWIDDENDELRLFITISKPNEHEFYEIFQDFNDDLFRTFLVVNTVQEDYKELSDNSVIVRNNNSCNKHDRYISFNLLSWDEIVIAPEGYMAFKCIGKCHRHDHSMANHAKMLNIIPQRFNNVCCVPSKYFPLPIMFYDKFGNVVIKIYQEMIVAECSCR